MVSSVSFEETGLVEEKGINVRPENLSTADEQDLKVISLKKELTKELRDDSSSVHLIRTALSGGLAIKKPFLRNENREKKLIYAKLYMN